MGARGCGGQGCRPGLPRSGDRPRRRPCRPEALPFPTTRSASSNPFTGSEKVTAIENAPVTGSLAELVMVTVGAAVFAVMENWSAAALGFPELSCAAPAAMSTVTVPETSGVIVAVCKVAGFTAGRGEPRHRATGIVGQLPRVRGQTPGLPRGGDERRSRSSTSPAPVEAHRRGSDNRGSVNHQVRRGPCAQSAHPALRVRSAPARRAGLCSDKGGVPAGRRPRRNRCRRLHELRTDTTWPTCQSELGVVPNRHALIRGSSGRGRQARTAAHRPATPDPGRSAGCPVNRAARRRRAATAAFRGCKTGRRCRCGRRT